MKAAGERPLSAGNCFSWVRLLVDRRLGWLVALTGKRCWSGALCTANVFLRLVCSMIVVRALVGTLYCC
jgi:hypothetical protein